MSIFGILTWVCVGFVFVVFIIAIISVSQWVMWHYLRKCKCCGHLMKFKGFREDKEDGSYYLFHCPKCGKWEKVTYLQMIREMDGDFNLD